MSDNSVEKAKNVVVDFGHSGTKAGDGNKEIFLPSVISNDVFRKKDKSFFKDFNLLNNLIVEYKGVEFAAGELGVEKGGNHKISDDTSTSAYAEQLIVASLAYLCKDKEEINLLLSLPTTHFRNKAAIANRFTDKEKDAYTLKVGIYDYDLKKIVNKEIKINNIDIKPEGYYMIADYILDNQGNISKDKKEISKGLLVGLDCGYYSTDPYITENGIYLDLVPQKTIPGLHLVHERLSDIIKDQTGIEKSPYEIEKYIRQGWIRYKGQTIDLKEPTKKLYRFLAQTIADQMKNLLQERFYEVDKFIFGGGSIVPLKEYIDINEEDKQKGDKAELFHSAEILDNPRFVNVRAGLKYAKKVYGVQN